MIDVDMVLARDALRARLRAARGPLLAALDVAFIRALEAGDKAAQAEITARKQALRDAPDAPEIAAAATPDDLTAHWTAWCARAEIEAW